eukprot:9083440-Pyramimonas_sp.AAC.1
MVQAFAKLGDYSQADHCTAIVGHLQHASEVGPQSVGAAQRAMRQAKKVLDKKVTNADQLKEQTLRAEQATITALSEVDLRRCAPWLRTPLL